MNPTAPLAFRSKSLSHWGTFASRACLLLSCWTLLSLFSGCDSSPSRPIVAEVKSRNPAKSIDPDIIVGTWDRVESDNRGYRERIEFRENGRFAKRTAESVAPIEGVYTVDGTAIHFKASGEDWTEVLDELTSDVLLLIGPDGELTKYERLE